MRGEILVNVGDRVDIDTTVAKAEIKGDFHTVNAASGLGVAPSRVRRALRVEVGETIKQGQLLGETKALLGLIRNRLISPVDGVVEDISPITGQLVVAKPSVPLTLSAHLAGVVVETDGHSMVRIESQASIVQGIFGIGQEAYGRLYAIGAGEEDVSRIPSDEAGVVLMTTGPLTQRMLTEAMGRRIAGVVAASASGRMLTEVAGALNPASTGQERIGMTIILTEGFGRMEMARPCRRLLQALVGQRVSLLGVTQVRAGVIRPELIGPPVDTLDLGNADTERFDVGASVRIVRGETFGAHGAITEIPNRPQPIPSGGKALVYHVRLSSGHSVVVPRANVEWITNG